MARYPGYLKANSWRTVYTERKRLFNHVLAKEQPSRESPCSCGGRSLADDDDVLDQ